VVAGCGLTSLGAESVLAGTWSGPGGGVCACAKGGVAAKKGMTASKASLTRRMFGFSLKIIVRCLLEEEP
jgi:hypothetical protein